MQRFVEDDNMSIVIMKVQDNVRLWEKVLNIDNHIAWQVAAQIVE